MVDDGLSAIDGRAAVAASPTGTDAEADHAARPRFGRARELVAATRLGRRLLDEPPLVLLAGAIGVWVWVFGLLVWRRHDRFGTFDFDLGHHDQAIWLLAHGKGFITVSGMPVLGHHVTLAYFALVPFYWLGAGPQFLNLVQTLALALAAVPIYLYARDRLANAWPALALAVAWLLNPSVQWLCWETWHPETVAIPFFLTAYLMASRRRWPLYWVGLVAAMAWKEDISLAVAVLGLVFVVRGQRRIGLATLAAGLLWFAVAYGVVMPHFNGGTNQAGIFYGELGRSPTDIARTAVSHPSVVTGRLSDNDALGYARDLLAPWGFVPLAAPLLLVVAAPQFFANVLAVQGFFFDIRYHYVAIILAVLALTTVEGVARLRQPGLRRFAVGVVAAAALATSAAWGISPISTHYREGFWPLADNARQGALEAATSLPPDDASVSASYSLVPHLTHRDTVYSFPNPWIRRNWGVAGVAPHDPASDHDPADVQWLVVDRAAESQNPTFARLLDRLLTDGEFEIVSERDGIVVARRVAPPPP